MCQMPVAIRAPLGGMSPPRISSVTSRLGTCLRIFESLSPALIDCVNGKCDCETNGRPLTVETILGTHDTLDSVTFDPELCIVQLADAHLTREYLHLKTWQACVSHGLLRMDDPASVLAIGYPLDRLVAVAGIIASLPFHSLSGNGFSMV